MSQKVQRGLLFVVPVFVAIFLLSIAPIDGWAQKGRKPPKNTLCSAFTDNFDGTAVDGNRWVVANGQAPGYRFAEHIGYYQPDRVSVSEGYLRIRLTQEYGTVDGVGGVISRGGLVYSKLKCGYGTYEWTVRMSTTADGPMNLSGGPVTGSVSAGFNYVNNSDTEIDFEFSAKDPQTLWMVNWHNTNTSQDPTEQHETYSWLNPFDSTTYFHHYKYVWEPGKITFYADGVQRAVHTTDVPSAAAYFMINHWGTDGPNWGGYASPYVTRYYYIDSVKFTPLP
ncbi:MAG: glycoside hydrolase family 16 protein [Acidobacteria bacterium]|nr:glycoside hydrolase family 16 protein [Acidobacteriota bacterium]